MVTSGKHLGAVRSWIQWNATNGSDVIWGSNSIVNLTSDLTVKVLEDLAQTIRDAVVREIFDMIPNLKDCEFEPWGNDKINICNKCGMNQRLHEEADRIYGRNTDA